MRYSSETMTPAVEQRLLAAVRALYRDSARQPDPIAYCRTWAGALNACGWSLGEDQATLTPEHLDRLLTEVLTPDAVAP